MNILLELIPRVASPKKYFLFTIHDLQFKSQKRSKVEILSNNSNLEFDHCTFLNHYQKCRSTNVEKKDIIDVDWPYVWVGMCMYNTNEFGIKSMFLVVKLFFHPLIVYASFTILLPWTKHK